jgi:hypothetical protein
VHRVIDRDWELSREGKTGVDPFLPVTNVGFTEPGLATGDYR